VPSLFFFLSGFWFLVSTRSGQSLDPFFSRSFLDDLYRIAHRGYEPTDDDVVRARLRTMGVQEYRFLFETGERLYLFFFLSRHARGHGHVDFFSI
jgi:hypothetical protein